MSRIFFLVFVFLTSRLYAQEALVKKGQFVDQITGTIHYAPQGGEIQGSPFLFENWLPGSLVLRSGRVQQEFEIKFDVYSNKFVVSRNDTAYEVGPDVKEIRLYKAGKVNDTLVFRRGFTGLPNLNQQSFVQVLATGNITFLKVHRMQLDEVKEYNNANKIVRFRHVQNYGISRHGSIEVVRLTKMDLLTVLSEQKEDAASFMTKEKLSGKDEKSWVKVISFVNML